jgi:hypothetical protein
LEFPHVRSFVKNAGPFVEPEKPIAKTRRRVNMAGMNITQVSEKYWTSMLKPEHRKTKPPGKVVELK